MDLIFDLDDTLTGVRFPDGSVRPTAAAYDDVIDRFVVCMERDGWRGPRVRERQHDIDMVLAATHGFADKTRFAQSMVDTYREACQEIGSPPRGYMLTDVFDIGMSVFTDYPYAALDGALEVLERVCPHYVVSVVTKGEDAEQRKKIADSGVGELIDYIFVVGKKDDADWNRVLTALNNPHLPVEPETSWAIGNSTKADVNPLLGRGFNGIHIMEQNGWAFEQAPLGEALDGRTALSVTHIRDVLDVIPLPAYARA